MGGVFIDYRFGSVNFLVKEAVNPKFRKKVDHPSNFKRCQQRKFIMIVF